MSINNSQLDKSLLPQEHERILEQLRRLYAELFWHDGYGELSLEMRFLKRGQKEIILHCGKDFRFVVDYPGLAPVGRAETQAGGGGGAA
jgi:hypothetical protein